MRSPSADAPEVALGHDYLLVLRGAERVFCEIAAIWPNAPIHTLLADEHDEMLRERLGGRTVHVSSLQRLGVRQDGFRALLPLYPLAAGRMRIEASGVLVTDSSAFAIGFRPPPGVPHVCYCHSPFRYAWHAREQALAEQPAILRPAVGALLDRIRRWELDAASRVTHLIANSEHCRRMIADYWGRDAEVIHAPVDVERFTPSPRGERLLVIGEVTRHKRTAVAIEAAVAAGVPITVVGDGPDKDELEARYRDPGLVEFAGRVDDRRLTGLIESARAVVVPSTEEFGIVAVEAQAAGKPVLALGAGGAVETVIAGETGILVDRPDPELFAAVLRSGELDRIDQARCRENAERFSAAVFRGRMAAAVNAQR
ncbi:MAG: glycosyltransferase [Baekduia sp.]